MFNSKILQYHKFLKSKYTNFRLRNYCIHLNSPTQHEKGISDDILVHTFFE